ncbi:hypothetical protein Tco_0554336 [Tanacetum coccineum]
MAWNLGSSLSGLERAQNHIQSSMSSLKEDTYSIKTMIIEMYEVFKGQSSGSGTPTLALTHIPVNVEGENDTNTAIEDPPSHTKGETNAIRQEKLKEPKHSTDANIELIGSSEEAKKLVIHPKDKITTKVGEKFKKAQDVEHEVLKRQHTEKVRKYIKLMKHKFDNYMWTISSRLKPETITDIKIHLKTKPVVITVFRGTDGRNFNVHKPFAFELGIKSALPALALAPEQALSKSSRKKRKHMELEPEIKILRLESDRALIENVLFVNNMVIEEPEHGIFFTDEFGDQAFQRWSDIDKVGMEALVSYLVAASMV